MRRILTMAAVVATVTASALAGAGTASAAATGTVYVVHGIPGTPVDVYVDGARAIDDFEPATVKGPLELPAGKHTVELTAADAKDNADPILTADATVPDGGNVSLVAHLDASGKPAITPFVNDVSKIAAGQTRLVVRHVAAAPAVDVRAGGKVVLSNVTNPDQGVLNIPAGSVSADVTLAGTDTVVIGPADLNLAEGSATFVHAIGSAADKTLALVSFTVTGLHSAPGGVPAGSGPKDGPIPIGLLMVILLAGLGLVVVSARTLRRGESRQ